ncbi:hypothetical protein [Acinetobacter baumannii]|uniref:hypothetical protein n=1 Tax=Acinetobacter baumannii TaxID=470 RepID=UPI000D13BD45|nr:hypothetical protein [Acinetobacter baumannii]MBP4451261.1 hypothetical protein [Acinetobacter baumannii]MBP4539780.1 hypothetical protein [Acinetobacter baumannii]MCF4651338.1 hypothetical protein [Acinetobacter baumannii]MDC5604398.1 hypothetical protein [Acinetobacter baumannii]MDV7378678.1 hypothetical protein [Acinetobacter baumannii]
MIEKNEMQELIVDSPVEFVLIGTYLNERVIIARSTNYEIDLLSEFSDSVSFKKKSYFSNFLSIDSSFKILNISSGYVRKSGMDRTDTLKFVWRGLGTDSKMQKILDQNAPLIYSDINRNRLDKNLKWILADLIFLANNSNKKALLKVKNNKIFILGFLILYLLFGIFVFISLGVKNL